MLLWSIYWNLINIMHESIPGVTIPPTGTHPGIWFDWLQYRLAQDLRKTEASDLCHLPDFES
jgi:hypothetical protein